MEAAAAAEAADADDTPRHSYCRAKLIFQKKEEKNMEKPKHHIFVCCSFRALGEPQGVCYKKNGAALLGYLESELSDRGMADVQVSSAGCLKVCDRGPAIVVYPENYWYGGVTSEAIIDEILDALETGGAAEDYLLC